MLINHPTNTKHLQRSVLLVRTFHCRNYKCTLLLQYLHRSLTLTSATKRISYASFILIFGIKPAGFFQLLFLIEISQKWTNLSHVPIILGKKCSPQTYKHTNHEFIAQFCTMFMFLLIVSVSLTHPHTHLYWMWCVCVTLQPCLGVSDAPAPGCGGSLFPVNRHSVICLISPVQSCPCLDQAVY